MAARALLVTFAFKLLHRNKGTFSNYCTYLKTACLICNVPVDVFQHPALARAKASILKRRKAIRPREPMFITSDMVEDIVLATINPEVKLNRPDVAMVWRSI